MQTHELETQDDSLGRDGGDFTHDLPVVGMIPAKITLSWLFKSL